MKLGVQVVGFSVLVLCYPLNVFTSLLLAKVREKLPAVVTFGDAFELVSGPMAGRYGYGVLYIYLFMCMANYLIVLGDSVQAVIYWKPVCGAVGSLAGAALLVPLNQFRTLTALTFLSALSFATILATLGLCLLTLLSEASCTGQHNSPSFLDYSACISGIVFAFTGQPIMLEMQAEMKEPQHFPKAVWLSYSILFVVYSFVAVLSYLACGNATPGDILLVLPEDWRKSLAGALMVIHLMVTYTILQQVLNRAICVCFLPGALEQSFLARLKWFGVTSCVLAACYSLANLVPLFQALSDLDLVRKSCLSGCGEPHGSPPSVTNCIHPAGAPSYQHWFRPRPCVLFLLLYSFELAKRESQGGIWIGAWFSAIVGVAAARRESVTNQETCGCYNTSRYLGLYLVTVGTVSSVLVIAAKLSSTGGSSFNCEQ